jgi:Mg-chelatase subunit ChlD
MAKYTKIVMVLDRSGSMQSIKADTIGGVNQFLEDQKKVKGKAEMTLVLFDDKYDVVFEDVDIQDVKDLDDNTFVPRGMTALLDAIGKTISSTYGTVKSAKKKDRPEQVVFVVVTDGGENHSREYTREAIFNMITEMKEKDKWEFMFLGANQDAIEVGGQYGFAADSSLTYAANSKGVSTSYMAMSDKISTYRSQGKMNSFSEDERKESMGDDE